MITCKTYHHCTLYIKNVCSIVQGLYSVSNKFIGTNYSIIMFANFIIVFAYTQLQSSI